MQLKPGLGSNAKSQIREYRCEEWLKPFIDSFELNFKAPYPLEISRDKWNDSADVIGG